MNKSKMIDEQLREAIKASGLTSYRLGKMAGMHPTVIDRFKDGADLRLATAAKLAESLGLALENVR